MRLPQVSGPTYRTEQPRHKFTIARILRGTFWFYLRYALLVVSTSLRFISVQHPYRIVVRKSMRFLGIIEAQGAMVQIEGLDRFPEDGGPYVFACNHMSTLDVNLVPGLISDRMPMSLIIKKSLSRTPFFGRIVRKLKPIFLERSHPGEDLMQVLNEGSCLLGQGKSVLIFPEGTRQAVFSERKFNSLAVKLALRAGVSVVPVAVRTDFWSNGKRFKVLGVIDAKKPVHICFGHPIRPSGRGKAEHQQIVKFIFSHLEAWGAPIEIPGGQSS